MKKKYWFFIITVILIGSGGYFWYTKANTKPQSIEAIKRGTIVKSVYGIGTLTAERTHNIKSGVTSTIKKIYVEEGQQVKKGEALLDLEGIGKFEAPFGGSIVSSPFKEGETIYPQAIILSLVDPTSTYLLVSLEQQGALDLKTNLPVKISFDGLREQVFDGKVVSIFSNGSEFLAHISIDALPDFILPGMTADVAIVLEEKKDALLVPVASLEDKTAVLSRGGKTVRVPVEIGLVDGAFAEVLSGDVQVGDEAILIKKKSR